MPTIPELHASKTAIALPLAQVDHKETPDHKLQINHELLFERVFEKGAFVSAHLARLQHGCFSDKNIHSKDTLHVTFAAINFTFHPVTSSGSSDHRFESAVIEISAKSCNAPLKFLKYAPHMGFGRISSASLKWHFKLGALVGVTKGPTKAELTTSVDYEKDIVVGTMMKMYLLGVFQDFTVRHQVDKKRSQGSTRSTMSPPADVSPRKRIPDTKIVWTLEENTQQKAGIPREFTFVFLMERPAASLSQTDKTAITDRHVSKVSLDKIDKVGNIPGVDGIIVHQSLAVLSNHETGDAECVSTYPHNEYFPLEDNGPPGNGMIDNLKARAARVTDQLHPQEKHDSLEVKTTKHVKHELDEDFASVFKEIQFSIFVKPEIAGVNITKKSLFEQHPQLTVVDGEIGQRFVDMSEDEITEDGLVIEGLYNFARLPGSFEDLIELPGNTTTTIEPTLYAGGKK